MVLLPLNRKLIPAGIPRLVAFMVLEVMLISAAACSAGPLISEVLVAVIGNAGRSIGKEASVLLNDKSPAPDSVPAL